LGKPKAAQNPINFTRNNNRKWIQFGYVLSCDELPKTLDQTKNEACNWGGSH